MIKPNIIEELGFDRAVSIHLDNSNISDSQATIIEQIKEFDIDDVYFCTDIKENSYPAIFIKKVDSFNEESLKKIATTHKQIWNYKKVIFFYVYSETEIRIYNCAEKPLVITQNDFDYAKELKSLEVKSYQLSDQKQLEELYHLFSSVAVDTGIIWTIEEAHAIRKKISLQRRVDKYLVNSLITTARELQNQGLELDYIHKIIMRSLFLLYLEDRNATTEKFYSKIKEGAKSYFDILDNVQDTYALFEKLEDYFNGNVFTLEDGETITKEQLQLIKKCFINGNDKTEQLNLFDDWKLFDFSIIQIELLSEIYESFLSEINPEKKHNTGTYYTPPSLVELVLNEKLSVNKNEKQHKLKVLDPSCGSGIFLVESFKRLVKRYENDHSEKLTKFSTLKQLLTDNIFGIEIDSQSIKVTAFSLYLALVDKLNPKTVWQHKNYRLPYLINNPNDKTLKKQGGNLFCRDTIETNTEIENIKFDLIVGNPPFGTKKLLPSLKKYNSLHGFANEMVLPFLHKATKFSPRGEIVLIFNTKVLTNTGGTYQKFRRWLFNECYVEKIYNFSILRNAPKDFGGQLFGSATGPISVVFYKKDFPKKRSKTIIYYAPKTFIKSNIIEGVSIDSTDVKYLPRLECQKPNTKIWKIAMWGELSDLNLLDKLYKKHPTINEYFKTSNIDYGVGFQSSYPRNKINESIRNFPLHTPKNVRKYYTSKPKTVVGRSDFHRLGKVDAFNTNHVLLNEGVKVQNDSLSITASYIDYQSAFTKGLVGIFSKENDFELLKLITLYLNSNFVKYYSFLTTSSWGIERDVVKHRELFQAPYLLSSISSGKKQKLLEKFDTIKSRTDFFSIQDTAEEEINAIVTEALSEKDKIILKQLLDNLDLFHKKDKSIVLKRVLSINDYAIPIQKELNNFLNSQDLFANITTYTIDNSSPLMMIKVSFEQQKKKIQNSNETITKALKNIDKILWDEKATNIYFRKRLNFKTDNNVYLIRPNQRRFWSHAMALEDASELILEILIEI